MLHPNQPDAEIETHLLETNFERQVECCVNPAVRVGALKYTKRRPL